MPLIRTSLADKIGTIAFDKGRVTLDDQGLQRRLQRKGGVWRRVAAQ